MQRRMGPGSRVQGAHRSSTTFASTIQKTSRVMSCNDGGDLAAAAADHIQDHERDHVATRSMDEAAGSEEDEKCCGDREPPFFQCTDGEEPSGMDDAATEFPGGDEDDEEGYDDGRASFATAVDDRLWEEQAELEVEEAQEDDEDMSRYDYGMWIATEPVSIQERRRRLLHGMGLAASSKDLLRSRNPRTMRQQLPPDIPRSVAPRRRPPLPAAAAASPERGRRQNNGTGALTRCRSDSRLSVRGVSGGRKPPTLGRVWSLPHSLHGSPSRKALRAAARCPLPLAAASKDGGNNGNGSRMDIGKEFMVNGQINGRQIGAQMSVDEFERFIGYTPLVTQLIRRSQSQPVPASSAGSDDAKPALKKRTRWLKNIKLVASVANLINETKDKAGNGRSRSRSSSSAEEESTMSKSASAHAAVPSCGASGPGAERLKVHHYGTSSKELTGLYLRQEVRAHEGSIWTMKFSPDARLLATGGEDRVVRVWRVVDGADAQEPEHPTSMPPPPPLAAAEDRPGLAAQLSKKVRLVGRSSKHVLPEHVVVPESVFALAKQPACAFEGHQDDVLDLSWSKSQQLQLLSSSMDKTVRLWEMDTGTCLKLFAHNDYVTCVQFNPVDDGYFISGSLDSKVRIWSVPERQVVDWSDLNDMVTAACYTPDGQAAIIGSHKGSCRFYKTTDCKLNQEAQVDMSISKKRKSQAKKITGFQFAPGNPSEILVTSADSQIRVFNGITVLQKFKGFKNTSSQISACYTADGRYVVCASEDSHVYLWRRGGCAGVGGVGTAGIGVRAKTWLTSRSYEYFFCRDVSVAVPWPGAPPPLRPCASSVHGGSSVPRRPMSGLMTHSSSAGGQLPPASDLSSRQEPSAWGMVVVTASRGGEIRVYQNFGLPLGVKGQSNLFSH